MVGQKKLLNIIENSTLDNFPHTVLIAGEKGSGKHTLTDEICKKLTLKRIDVFDLFSSQDDIREYVQETIYTTADFGVYVFDFTKAGNMRTDKLQFTLLKLAEEPLNNIFIIIIAENKEYVLNTILNRCQVFEMEPYTRDELMTFTQDATLLSILRTPGQILSTNPQAVQKCSDVAETICEKINTINLPNLLKVVDMINYKDEFDKIDFDLFFDVIINKLFVLYKDTKEIDYLHYYLFVVDERKKIRTNQKMILNTSDSKERFIEHFLVSLWEVARGM